MEEKKGHCWHNLNKLVDKLNRFTDDDARMRWCSNQCDFDDKELFQNSRLEQMHEEKLARQKLETEEIAAERQKRKPKEPTKAPNAPIASRPPSPAKPPKPKLQWDSIGKEFLTQNESLRTTAKQYGISHTTLQRHLTALGIEVHRSKRAQLDDRAIEKMYLVDCWSPCKIAKVTGVTNATIKRRLIKMGIYDRSKQYQSRDGVLKGKTERIENAKQLHGEGLTVREIADKLKLSITRVYNIHRASGLTINKKANPNP